MSETNYGTIEAALRLWSEIVSGLRLAGYQQVVPEYMKLSCMLSQTRMTELVKGQPEAAHWMQLRDLGREALESLGPFAEAARILSELPSDLRVSDVESTVVAVEMLPEALAEEPKLALPEAVVAENETISELILKGTEVAEAEEGLPTATDATVPLLTLVNIPAIAISEATIDMDLQLVSHEESKSGGTPGQLDLYVVPAKKQVVRSADQALTVDSAGTIKLHVIMRQEQALGLDKIQRLLDSGGDEHIKPLPGATPTPASSTPTPAPSGGSTPTT